MSVLSKEISISRTFLYKIFTSKKTAVPIIFTIILLFSLNNYRYKKLQQKLVKSSFDNRNFQKLLKLNKKKQDGTFTIKSLGNLIKLFKIAVPGLFSELTFDMVLMIATLFTRTYLSILVANVKGSLVQAIMARDLNTFFSKIL